MLRNKYALVTGASRGIGRAIAAILAREGCNLYLTCSKSLEELTQLSNTLSQEYSIICEPYQVDMGDYRQVEALFANHIHKLDYLINNAGISYIGLLSDMSIEEWHQLINVNLNSCFYTAKHSIPLFLEKHAGKILQISSVWGNVGASCEVAYSTAKGGMNLFTKALAKELAPSHIQVNCIACGCIDTQMNQCFSPEEREALIEEIPANRMGTPEEVARLVLQLLTAPDYLTGQIITIDGGWY